MADRDKNTEAVEDDLPITNDFQYNEMVRTLRILKEKAALHKTSKPHEEAAAKAEVKSASRELIVAANEMRVRHGAFPLNRWPDNYTNEQRRAHKKLYAEVQAKRQMIKDGATDVSRHFESLVDFIKAFGFEVPDVLKENEHSEEPKQKGWMPKKYTPVDLEGNILKSEELRSTRDSSILKAQRGEDQDDETGDQPEKKMKELKIEDSQSQNLGGS